ncbi:MAG: tetratricopeptide repeat protein [Bryobacterales bacterium]|nr:tetratricopeptide repeat protein [Bryobacterales bacterium]
MWRSIHFASAVVLVGGNLFSVALLLCFRDLETRVVAGALLAVGTWLSVPLVIRPMGRWMRRSGEVSLYDLPVSGWMSGLALFSAKAARKRTEKAAHLVCESGVLDAAGCRFQQADWKLREAAEIFEELEDPPNQALALMELGNSRNAAGDQDGAIEAYLRALAIWEQIAETQRAGNTWRLLNNLSAAYSEKGDLDAAERYSRRALHTAKTPEAEAMCQLNLADIYRKRREFGMAQEALDGSLDRLGASGDEGFAFGVMTLAMVHDDQQDVHAAEELYKQARELMEQKLGPRHIEVARLLERHGALLERHGRSREGARLMAEAAGIRDTVG